MAKKAFSIKQFSPNVLIKSELIEVVIPINTGSPKTKIQLPDNQNLRNTHIRAIDTYVFSNMPMSIVSRNTVVSAALLNSIFLTLQGYNGKNFMWQKPLNKFLTFGVNSDRFPVVFCGQKVNYPKSYIEIADSSLISVLEAQSVILDISYSEFEAVEKADRQASFKNQS
jgi:hypothetical protein